MRRATPAAFLDRDGVLNAASVDRARRPHPPCRADQVVLLPRVPEACEQLRAAGLRLIVVTNQPDVARGTTPASTVTEINQLLRRLLPLDDVVVCLHDDSDECRCRKPKPGLILSAASRWNIDLAASTLVGDRWRDIDAGRAAGVATVFLDRGYREPQPVGPDLVASELIDAVPFIIRRAMVRSTPT